MKKLFLSLLAAVCCVISYSQTYGEIKNAPKHETVVPSFKSDASKKAPKNVILLIGDGMGLGQLSSAMYANGGQTTITNLKSAGFVRTQSKTDFTTDSAASGTAYACGIKTHNGAIGVDVDNTPVKNIPEKLAAKGIVSGVVSTDDIIGATPAAFYAHQPSRGMSDEIFADMASSKLSFFSAGSIESFNGRPESVRSAVSAEYVIVSDLEDPAASSADKLGYLPSSSVVYDFDEDGNRDYLTSTTQYAIDFLSSKAGKKTGFFLMVEGARIDKKSHANNYHDMVLEALDFDKAVTAAIRFAEKDGNTLVVISADHETGAAVVTGGNVSKGDSNGMFSTGGHTPMPVPIFAYGPGSQYFMGVQENSDVSNRIVRLLGR